MTVVYPYLKKITNTSIGCFLLIMLFSCPGDDMDCNDFSSIAEISDLFLLEPEQSNYLVGDEIILKVNIPAVNNYYGSELDLFGQTGDESALLILGFQNLFEGNQLTFIKGSQSDYPNWFNMPYDPILDKYQLEVGIIFSGARQYSSSPLGTVTVQGDEFCNRFFIDSNIQWTITNGRIEFTVTD